MRKYAVLVPLFSFAAGIGGYYLRKAELLHVFDPLTGLPERNALISNLLIGLTFLFLFVVTVFALFTVKKYKTEGSFSNIFNANCECYPITFVIIGLTWTAGTLIQLFSLLSVNELHTIDIYFAALSLLSAVSVACFAVEIYQGSKSKTPYALSIIPALFLCFWLVLVYSQNSANPILLSYVYLCLAIVAAAMSFYFTTGFLYDKPAPGKSIFSYSAAIFFCFIALADELELGIILIFCAIIVSAAFYQLMLLRNLKIKPIEHKAVVEPEPEVVVEPEPKPMIEPESEPVVEPEPEVVVEPEPEPEPEPTIKILRF